MKYIKKKSKKILKSLSKFIGIKNEDKHSKVKVYIISYPKCGRTWLRVLIGKVLCDRYKLPSDMILDTYGLTSEAGVPRTKFTHDVSSMVAGYDYRKLKGDKKRYKDKKIIFIIRNVKDVIVSSYFQTTKRKKLFEGTISEFVRSNEYGAKKIVTFYSIWYANRELPLDFLLVRYEDLHAKTKDVLKQVLEFIGIGDTDEEIIENAVSFSRFENMKKMEKEKVFSSYKMNPGDENDSDSFKVRKGKVKGYREHLSEEDIRYIDDVIRDSGCPFCMDDLEK